MILFFFSMSSLFLNNFHTNNVISHSVFMLYGYVKRSHDLITDYTSYI